MKELSIIVKGEKNQGGTYILFITLLKTISIVIGKFQDGKSLKFRPGNYIYIGSALAERGATSLGNRLQRHLLRSQDSNNHHLLTKLRLKFMEQGINYTQKPSEKHLKWHIDFFLDNEHTSVKAVFIKRGTEKLEEKWFKFIYSHNTAEDVYKGLGASDYKKHSHLLRTDLSKKEFQNFCGKLS